MEALKREASSKSAWKRPGTMASTLSILLRYALAVAERALVQDLPLLKCSC